MIANNKYLVALIWISLLGLEGCIPVSTSLETRQIHNHYPQSQTTLEQIWSVTDAYVSPNVYDITLDAANGIICYLGDYKDVPLPKKIICRNSKSGQMEWEHESGIPGTIEVTHNGIFVGFNNRAKIVKFDLEGNQIWERKLNSGGISFMSFADEEIQTLTVVHDLWILDKNGNLINRISDQKIFITTPDETFINLNGIQALDTKSGRVLWEYINSDIRSCPHFYTG